MTTLIESKTSEELYEFLINDIHNTNIIDYEQNNINICSPDIYFDITKKTVWKNFAKYPIILKRDKNHLINHVNKELKTTTSENIEEHLLISGKHTSAHIITVIVNYIQKCVRCGACKSINTTMIRNSSLRLYFINCIDCKAETVVKK